MFSSGMLAEERVKQYDSWNQSPTVGKGMNNTQKSSVGGFDLKKLAPIAALLFVGFVSQSANLSFVHSSGAPSHSSLTLRAYPSQGVFPGGGDGSWREGKKGSFNKGQKVDIEPAMFSSGMLVEGRVQKYTSWNQSPAIGKGMNNTLGKPASVGGFDLKKLA